MDDPFELERFVEAQAPVFAAALAELEAGRKRTHWMWFVFPQLRGLGSSAMADRYGIDSFLPTDRRNATVLELLRRGHAGRMLLSQDYTISIANGLDWYPPEMVARMRASGAIADWSMTFLFERVIPALRECGMTDAQLHTMMVENPRRWLAVTP